MKRQISLNKVMDRIEHADALELGEIIKVVVHRHDCIAPDWEAVFLSLPKSNPEERNRQLDLMVDFLRNYPPKV